MLLRRHRQTKIVATLGPASSDFETINQLFLAGADVFRLNMSHGTHDDHYERYKTIREVEAANNRPIAVLADMQGPKLRVGVFADGPQELVEGAGFRLDLEDKPGDAQRVTLPHPEIFAALSDRKGVNVPDVVLPIPALTEKDRKDLEFACELGADWIALSFVQRAADVLEARELINKRAAVLSKIEKPACVVELEDVISASDGLMVARGDLGVEMAVQDVPAIQKRIVRACRAAGKPVIVATQMLESMIEAPVPTRAEVSDVATAIYEGADAVMLSAESAAGKYPLEAVTTMNAVAERIEQDEVYTQIIAAARTPSRERVADAITVAAREIAETVDVKAIACFTHSGTTANLAARERPMVPILALTPFERTARRMALVWGLHCAVGQGPDHRHCWNSLWQAGHDQYFAHRPG